MYGVRRIQNAIIASYTYGDDLLKMSRNGEYYYWYDGLGSVRIITDITGAVANRYTYDAYGNLVDGEYAETVANEYKFTGERVDAETGFVYLRARMYEPSTGRFLTRDTFRGYETDPPSLHKYLYCHDDPVNRVDPAGYESLIMRVAVMGILSIIGFAYINELVTIRNKSKVRLELAGATRMKRSYPGQYEIALRFLGEYGGDDIASGIETHEQGPGLFVAPYLTGRGLCDIHGYVRKGAIYVAEDYVRFTPKNEIFWADPLQEMYSTVFYSTGRLAMTLLHEYKGHYVPNEDREVGTYDLEINFLEEKVLPRVQQDKVKKEATESLIRDIAEEKEQYQYWDM